MTPGLKEAGWGHSREGGGPLFEKPGPSPSRLWDTSITRRGLHGHFCFPRSQADAFCLKCPSRNYHLGNSNPVSDHWLSPQTTGGPDLQVSGRRHSHRDVRGDTQALNVRDWASLTPENLSSPRAGGGWQFSVLRSDLSVPWLLPTLARGASTPHLRTNFLQFPGARSSIARPPPAPGVGLSH